MNKKAVQKNLFGDKLTFKYVEVAKFNKDEDGLVTLYDKWLYVLKNLSRLDKRPAVLREKIFGRLFAEAEIAAFNKDELREYEDSLKAYRDIKNSIDTALEEGLEQGRAEGRIEGRAEGLAEGLEKGLAEGLEKGLEKGRAEGVAKVAAAMLAKGMDVRVVSDLTGLSVDEIKALQ